MSIDGQPITETLTFKGRVEDPETGEVWLSFEADDGTERFIPISHIHSITEVPDDQG